MPWKHLAAVVYLIANEIDKNPFLVFEMHGFDLLAAIRGQRDEEEQTIVGIERELDAPCLFLHGGSSRPQRDAMVDTFQTDPAHRVNGPLD